MNGKKYFIGFQMKYKEKRILIYKVHTKAIQLYKSQAKIRSLKKL